MIVDLGRIKINDHGLFMIHSQCDLPHKISDHGPLHQDHLSVIMLTW